MTWTRSGGGSLGFGVGAAIGAKIAVGRERPVILHLGDGALGYSAMGFWTMARYNTAMLIVVSNNESYQVVRHNWAQPDARQQDGARRQVSRPDARLADGGLRRAGSGAGHRRRGGYEGEGSRAGAARGLRRVVDENRPYLLDVSVAREGIGADATWDHAWEL